MKLQELNQLSDQAASEELLRCCHSSRWVEFMLSRRPYGSFSDLLKAADEGFAGLQRQDWLEAFAGHPKIGDMNSLRAKYANTRDWSAGEQSGVNAAEEAVLQGLADGNTDYEKRFGHIFIVCATGKTAAQMLDLLRSRIDKDPAEELKIAANEQIKITKIRLEKLCQEVPSQPTC
jgi:2-oxo-4-hydroxy-4-carboxy-5-ureidoimidazoline decarboxylase